MTVKELKRDGSLGIFDTNVLHVSCSVLQIVFEAYGL